MFKTMQPLVLASGSPRRKRLLESVGIDFRVVPSLIDEPEDPVRAPADAARGLASSKALSVSAAEPEAWVLGADTIVVLDGEIFGKPVDATDAGRMLRRLAGRVHEVVTGVCLVNSALGGLRTDSVVTRVSFKHLTRGEIEAYVASAEPMDKAGAYGIQGIGAFLVRSIRGSYTNVVGLPLCETVQWLLDCGVILPA